MLEKSSHFFPIILFLVNCYVLIDALEPTNQNEKVITTTHLPEYFENGYYHNEPFELKWKPTKFSNESIDFEFKTNLNYNDLFNKTLNFWTAFAFSNDQEMGDDCVCMCYINNGQGSVMHYYNQVYDEPILIGNYGISNVNISLNDDSLTCSFTRKNMMKNVTNYFDLSFPNSYYLLEAVGEMSDNSFLFHTYRLFSEISISFTNFTPIILSTTKPPPIGLIYGQYRCEKFRLKWVDSAFSTSFTFSTVFRDSGENFAAKARSFIFEKNNDVPFRDYSSSLGIYSAFGLSEDRKMGHDNVILCKLLNDKGSIEHVYNRAKERPNYIISYKKSIGLSKLKISYINGILICSFDRVKNFPGIGNYFDINKNYHVLLAKGQTIDDVVQYHNYRFASTMRIDFQLNNSMYEDIESQIKVKAHGIIMMLTWMYFAPVGILIARYYRYLLPQLNWFNIEFWFLIHFPIMISLPILSIIAFLIILSDLNWKWVEDSKSTNFAHSILGILTITCSIFQVIVGLFRPKKDSQYRSTYNIFHKYFGFYVYIVSVITIFFGASLSRVYLGKVGLAVITSWTVWTVLIVILIEIQEFKHKDSINKSYIKLIYDKIAIFVSQIFTKRKKESSESSLPSKDNNITIKEKNDNIIDISKHFNLEVPLYERHALQIRKLEKKKTKYLIVHMAVISSFAFSLMLLIALVDENSFLFN